jgi:hypothetical protein
MTTRAAILFLSFGLALPVLASQITVKTAHYINDPDAFNSQTIAISYQLFNGSTDCTTGGGAVTTVTGVNQATGLTFETGPATSFRLVADPNGDPSFARSEQNGPFVSWGLTPGDTAAILTPGDGRGMCVSGFTTNTYFARLYVGIQAFDECGNLRTTFAPGETVYFRFAGGLTFEPEQQRVLAAGGSANECTFLPEPPAYATVHITTDPQTIPFTLPSSDAAIPPACASGNTTSILGNWRIVAYDPSCGCNRNQLNFTVSAVAPSSCPITCPSDITVPATAAACGANVSFTPPAGATCSYASGALFGVGSTTVTCSNAAQTCSFKVNVNDQQPPSIAAPADVSAIAGPSCTAAAAVGTATATDNCGSPTVSASRSDGQPLPSPYPIGTTTILWSAVDAGSNTATDTQTVTVSPAPLNTSLTAAPSRLWPPNHQLVPVTIAAATTGGCGAMTCAITGVTSNQPVFGPGQNKDPDWIIDDASHVRLRPERTQGQTRVYTITVTCTDGSSQTSTKHVTVSVANSGG